jgi:sterol desaturase/sphingolipid hydroxylase (fatty acid hydroxylase superfamily)
VRLYLAVVFGSLLAVALWEFCRPRRRREFPALRRRLGNLGIWLVNLLLVSFIFEPPVRFRSELEAVIGVNFPAWPIADAALSFVTAFLLLDLLRYAVHRCEHAVPVLWRFHALHHSDPDVDVTTSLRHHPIDYLLGSTAYWLAVIVLDFPVGAVLAHGLVVFAAGAVQHGNIRLPEMLDRLLQPVLVTIDMHRIHHSVVLEQANSNYGIVLSIWDRLFGTFIRIGRTQHNNIVFGVRELPRRDCLKFSAMFLTPWRIARAARTAARDAA